MLDFPSHCLVSVDSESQAEAMLTLKDLDTLSQYLLTINWTLVLVPFSHNMKSPLHSERQLAWLFF